ncbi:hypothetical protein QKC54_gp0195 [Megavirus baoshan]|uniref:Uncharacterized protein n=1 Tax=Megavirus baoshan TaxID=2496520 RepID=A0A3S5HLE4_9VIRU|nr:hypothetical protein QKC54_gp0195 [Megavirus baoshan]AZL89727.1 hypothetical protein Mb0877 [Megavirus baoshan]
MDSYEIDINEIMPATVPNLTSIILDKMPEKINEIKMIHGSNDDFMVYIEDFRRIHYTNVARDIINAIGKFCECYDRITNGQINLECPFEKDLQICHEHCLSPRPPIYIFGGFVRDLLAGNIYSDIDIRFGRKQYIDLFIKYCVPDKYIVKKYYTVDNSISRYSGKCITIDIFTQNNPNIIIELDCTFVFKDSYVKQIGGHDIFDLDVNSLALFLSKVNGNIISKIIVLSNILNLPKIIKNCRKNKFVILNKLGHAVMAHDFTFNDCISCTEYCDPNDEYVCYTCHHMEYYIQRIKKMISKGWIIKNNLCDNLSCLLNQKKLKIIIQ